jgi:para-nitrobenzyl esterase
MRTHSLFGFALLVGACSETTTGTPVTDASADVAVDVAADASSDTGGPTCTVPTPTDPVVARTDRGLVRGAMEGEALHWLGIPFAEPPTGANRWRPPVAGTACWMGERDATMWAPSCPQIPQQQGQPFDPMAPMEGQEDCLTLNVWRPANAPADAALPVMVFVHGGGNTVGSASNLSPAGTRIYDGTRLAARGNVVVVTIQYRIGALGWLVHPALEGEMGASAGNLALLDQVAALRWVQRNIRSFRGDPARVMLFGESAGAVNTCALVASPLAAGLFSRALMQSGSCLATQTVEAARAQGVMYAQAAGCASAPDAAACMRALSTEAAVRALAAPVDVSGLGASTVRWGPVVSAPALPTRPFEAMLTGAHNRVPVVVGHNTEEVGLTVPAVPTEAAYRGLLTQVGGAAFANQVIALYPVATYGTPRAALVQAFTDARFGCGARLAARAAARGQPGVNVYRYLYAHALEGSTATVRALGAWHGLELAYVFQNVAQGMITPTDNDRAVERAMLGYWTRFAATGDPNGAGAPAWPAYATGEPLLRIGATPTVERAWRNAECDVWDMVSRAMAPAP